MLSRDIAGLVDVEVGDEVILENSGTFRVTGIVANETAGSPLFAPIFVPPLPWYAYASIHDPVAMEAFGTKPGEANVLFIRTATEADARELAGARGLAGRQSTGIRAIGASLEVETAQEALPEIEDATSAMERFLLVAGLVSLAIGGIGILNTMLVMVGRRTQEIAILKALGLKGRQVTLLFMTEGVLMGVAGSVVGVLLGLLLGFGLTGVGERFLNAEIPWKLQTEPIFTGLVVGVIVTGGLRLPADAIREPRPAQRRAATPGVGAARVWPPGLVRGGAGADGHHGSRDRRLRREPGHRDAGRLRGHDRARCAHPGAAGHRLGGGQAAEPGQHRSQARAAWPGST